MVFIRVKNERQLIVQNAVSVPGFAKTGIVADFLHGVIATTVVERFIISTPAFNRLHNVKQNSTAFLTYPSLMHSRFAHSLGVMNVASEMYVCAIKNASDDDRSTFLDSLWNAIEALCTFGAVIRSSDAGFENASPEDITRSLLAGARRSKEIFGNTPHGLGDRDAIAYSVALQALRIAALVHDLGHPPFSHVTEFALEDLKAYVVAAAIDTAGCKALKATFRSATEKGKKLHESLTLALYGELVGLAETDSSKASFFRSTEDRVFAKISMALAEAILLGGCFSGSHSNLNDSLRIDAKFALACLRTLEDGVLDADRIDYVQRDVLYSGIRDRGFRSERLVSLLKLVYDVPGRADKYAVAGVEPPDRVPRVLPSVRSLRSLEEFFEWRSELYRTVLYHHHVVRTDSLFQALIFESSLTVLQKTAVESTSTRSGAIAHLSADVDTLSWLWQIHDVKGGSNLKMNVYLQWDDHWLMSVLRRRYIDFTIKQQQQKPFTTSEEIEFRRLEEIVASKKNYISLVKRYDHYKEINAEFEKEWRNLQLAKDHREATQSWKELPQLNEILLLGSGVMKSSEGANDLPQDLLVDEKFIFNRIGDVTFIPAYSHVTLKTVVDGACEQFKLKLGCLDLFWKNKPTRPSVGTEFKIWTDSGVDFLSKHSNLNATLNARAKTQPADFFYVLPKTSSELFNVVNARNLLGACIAQSLFKILHDERKDL